MESGYEYQSEFAKKYFAQGVAEGRREGRIEWAAEAKAQSVLTVLDARGVAVSAELRARILASTDLAELERWLQRAVSVSAADELFDR